MLDNSFESVLPRKNQNNSSATPLINTFFVVNRGNPFFKLKSNFSPNNEYVFPLRPSRTSPFDNTFDNKSR